ncbi:AEC family transporter [Lysinibacillus sp. NPDC097287]|uniref:AEC family transporter n=1 Tax=Lysinibacillus sp. NPDC097287 TaxID=3364144 RepID=UPI0038164412
MKILLDAVLPVFAIMFCGYLSGIFGIVTKSGSKSLNNYVFYVALPALLFLTTATAPVKHLANWSFISINLGGILASFIIAMIISKFVFKNDFSTSSLYGMNASYGTTGYMGIPLAIAAFGQEAALPAALATLIHNIPVITIVLLSFEVSRTMKNSESGKHVFEIAWDVLKPVLKNPLTISVVAGIVIAILEFELPTPIQTFAQLLSDASGPTALFALGLGLVGQVGFIKEFGMKKSEIAIIVALKLLIQPLITILLMMFVFEVDILWGIIAVLMSALPVGAGVFVFAQKYEKLEKQTSIGILVSMVISIFTVSSLLIYFS